MCRRTGGQAMPVNTWEFPSGCVSSRYYDRVTDAWFTASASGDKFTQINFCRKSYMDRDPSPPAPKNEIAVAKDSGAWIIS